MHRRKKILLYCVFAVSYIVVAFGVLRIHASYHLFYETYDVTWAACDIWLWYVVNLKTHSAHYSHRTGPYSNSTSAPCAPTRQRFAFSMSTTSKNRPRARAVTPVHHRPFDRNSPSGRSRRTAGAATYWSRMTPRKAATLFLRTQSSAVNMRRMSRWGIFGLRRGCRRRVMRSRRCRAYSRNHRRGCGSRGIGRGGYSSFVTIKIYILFTICTIGENVVVISSQKRHDYFVEVRPYSPQVMLAYRLAYLSHSGYVSLAQIAYQRTQ